MHTADQTTGKQREAWQASLPPSPPPMLHAHEDFYPDYPEDWIDVTEEASHFYLLPTHVTNVAAPTTYPLAEASGAVFQIAPNNVRQVRFANRSISTDLNEHSKTVPGMKDLLLAQNGDVHLLRLKKISQQRKH